MKKLSDKNIGMDAEKYIAENKENIMEMIPEMDGEDGLIVMYWGKEYAIRNGRIAK